MGHWESQDTPSLPRPLPFPWSPALQVTSVKSGPGAEAPRQWSMSPKRVRDIHGEGHSGPHWVCGCCRQVHNSTARPEPGRAARLEVGGPQVFLGAIPLFAGGWPGGELGVRGILGTGGRRRLPGARPPHRRAWSPAQSILCCRPTEEPGTGSLLAHSDWRSPTVGWGWHKPGRQSGAPHPHGV